MGTNGNKDDIVSIVKRTLKHTDRIVENLEDSDYTNRLVNMTEDQLVAGASIEAPLTSDLGSIIESGHEGLTKIFSGNETQLTRENKAGLEAIIYLEGRPALQIYDDDFPKLSKLPEKWRHLDNYRKNIKSTILSCGRIEVPNYPSRTPYIGSAWQVAEDVIMTNEHVAIAFSRPSQDGKWKLKYTPVAMDYGHDFSDTENSFDIEEVIGVHNEYDLALFRVSSKSTDQRKLPKPLSIAKEFDESKLDGRECYIVGYPAWDGVRNDEDVMNRIFGNLYGLKRLQPGTMGKLVQGNGIVEHTCSTLGGNSGSCVVDLETNKTIGLHFNGRYGIINHAVALWKLVDDPLLKDAGIQFS